MKKPLDSTKRLLPLFLMLWGLFGFGNFANLQAQIFPIRIIPTVIPPAPVYLFNYADRMALNSPLRVQLMLNDFTISNRQIRLKVYIEGSGIRTESKDFVAGAIPLTIDGGVPLFLTNAELAPYFDIQNLKGISPRMYGQSLREGSYRFCFEVYDFMTNRKLGNKTCATTFIYKNEPPILNFPKNKTTIKPRPVENIVFQWTPRHINVTNVQYELSIVEIWDDYVDPRTAFMTSPPIFQTTTRTTSFVYGAAQPLLMTNRRYAWQVKAKALKGLEEIGLFRNRGESEIFWFTKSEICQPPANVYGEPKGMSKINIYWDEDYNTYSEYEITYRQKDRPNSRWFTKRTNAGWATIWNLKEGTTYEYKVRGKCKYNYSPFSKIGVVTTATREDKSSIYDCGIVSDMKTITNREGLDNILIGDRFLAGGNFMVFITDLTSENHGVISGSGFVRVPYLGDARFAVTFDNILINTDYELVEGEVVTVYDPMFGEDAQMTVDVPISDWLENISNVITGLREEVQEAVTTGKITEDQANEFENQISEQEVLKEEIETELAKGEKQDEAKIKENRAKVDQITEDIKSSLADYETNKKMTSSGEGGIQGDSFFDGVIPFTTLDKKINFTPTDNSSSGNKELKLDVNKKDSLYFTRNIINRSNTSAYYVSQSNQTRDVLEQNEEYVKYKSDFLSFTKSQDKFGLWIHYDLDANEVKYKVAFNQNYFNNLIAKEDFISLLNKVLTYDLSGGIGSSIVSASEGISKLIEEYKDVYPELSQDLIKGYSTYELLSLITDFIKKCGKGVSNQAESTIVPRCLWDTEQTLFITYAYIAGFIDAGWSVVDGGVGMAKFMAAWSPVNPVFFTEEGSRIRKETLAAAAIIGELYNSEEKRDKAISAIFDQIIAYTDSTLSLDAQGRYQQGKLFFEVAGIFFGITELKIFLKTGKVTSSFLTGLRKLGKGGHRLILVLGKKLKVDKNKIVTYLMAANLQYEIARFGDDGVLIAKNWLDNPIEVIENIGEIPIKKSDKAVESIAEIGIVKGSDGSVGLGLLNKISKAGGDVATLLAKYKNVRKHLGNSRVTQYYETEKLKALSKGIGKGNYQSYEDLLKTAHPDVLDLMNKMDEYEFAQMTRGLRDLMNNNKLETFEEAIKSATKFDGEYGWLKYWNKTPGLKYALTTILDLREAGKLDPVGNATDIQLATIQAFTQSGDFLNQAKRYSPEFMGEFAERGWKYAKEGFDELRKVSSRLVKDELVFSGKAFLKSQFDSDFVNGVGKNIIEYKSFVSTSKLQSVAEAFTDLSKKWAGEGEKIAVVQRIRTKNGVYIDDFSDWGKNLGATRHSNAEKAIQIQEEVVLNPGLLKQVRKPIPIMENGVHKTINGMKAYFVDFIEVTD